MRIAYITAGAGGMYCGSCLHDNTLAGALGRLGHDVALIPTYTPIRTDEENHSIGEVFYGALNVYLEQKSSLFRHTPRLVDRWLNGERLLRWVAKLGGSTDPTGLGDLTLSVLQGEEGRQKKELERLVAWLHDELQPEIVHLTNSMFLGLARRIRERLGVPVVCTVQGEDLFIDALREPHRTRVRDELRARAEDVDAFVAPSRYYAELMREYIGIPEERMHHVPLGLQIDGREAPRQTPPEPPFVIGYLARLAPEKGLHLLVEAFRRLAESSEPGRVRLRIAGYQQERDLPYVEALMAGLEERGLDRWVERVGEVDRVGKRDFLRGLHVLSVPTTYREPKGLFVLEALAQGVPVVQPRHGAFPEVVQSTGGGLLVAPESPEELAEGLRSLMEDPARREELGSTGCQRVRERHSDRAEAEGTLEIYRSLVR